MESTKIITKCPVHIRTGPGIVYDVLRNADKGETFVSNEVKKDAANISWYRVNKGWICSKYVTLAQDINTKVENNSKKIGPNSASDFAPGVTQEIVNTGLSTLAKGISSSVLGDNGSGSLTSPEDSMKDNFLSRRAYGFPYQFRDTIDMRMGDEADNILGISFREAMSQFPMISYIPGRPSFLPDLDETTRDKYLESFSSAILNPMDQMANAFLSSEKVDMKFFTFEMDYVTYIRYVNTLCWIFAIYLGIGDSQVPGEESASLFDIIPETFDSSYSKSNYRNYHWGNYRLANYYAGRDTAGSRVKEKVDDINLNKIYNDNPDGESPPRDEAAKSILDVINDIRDLDEWYTDFYISPNIGYSETFTNDTKESMMAGVVKGASEFSKEIAFLLSAGAAQNLGDSQQALNETLRDLTGSLTGGTGIINRMMSGITTIISGANLVFPKIWTDSHYSRSFNIEIDLKTPYGNPESIFTDILVPMAHWICLAAPRQASINTYGAPFLIKFNIPGFCAVDMGIVNSLTITKGGDGSAWSTDGLPLEVHLSISIEDLYTQMAMGRINFISFKDAYNFFWNDSYLDFIATTSGVNMQQTSQKRKIELAKSLYENATGQLGGRFVEEIKQTVANAINRFSLNKILPRS